MSFSTKVTAKAPFISMNKLAEYMQASALRRRAIVKVMKEDKDFRKLHYSDVRKVIEPYFDSDYDNAKLDAAIARIEKKRATTVWDAVVHPNSIEALKIMKGMAMPDLSNYEVIADYGVKSITLGGVEVMIKPDVYLQHKKSGKVGAVKVHLAKTPSNRLSAAGLEYASTLIRQGYFEYGMSLKDVDHNACITLDIFSKTFGSAPTAFKRQLDDLESACEEIAARWATI